MAKEGQIRVGVGGWTFEPWRGVFYPKGLPHARELEYASQRLTSIEINGTFYRTQTPASFAKWRVRDARGLRVLRQRPALRRQPQRAEGGGRFHQAVPGLRGDRAGQPARASAVAIRGHQEVRRGRLRRLPGAAAAQARRREAAPRGGAAPPLVPHARLHRAPAQVPDPRGLCRARHLPRHPRSGRRFRLRPPAEGPGRHRHRLSAQGARPVGRARPRLGPGRRAEGPGAGGARQEGQGAAPRCVRLRHPRGQSPRPRRRHGADRAAEDRREQSCECTIAPTRLRPRRCRLWEIGSAQCRSAALRPTLWPAPPPRSPRAAPPDRR